MPAALKGCERRSRKCEVKDFLIKIPQTISRIVVVLPTPFREMGARRNSAENQTFGPRPKVWTRGQNGTSSAKDGAPEGLRCGTIQGEKLDAVDDVCRHCKKNNYPFVLSCIGKRTRKG